MLLYSVLGGYVFKSATAKAKPNATITIIHKVNPVIKKLNSKAIKRAQVLMINMKNVVIIMNLKALLITLFVCFHLFYFRLLCFKAKFL